VRASPGMSDNSAPSGIRTARQLMVIDVVCPEMPKASMAAT